MTAPKLRFGWVGVGVMGRHMCGHLMAAGHEAVLFSRTAAKCAPLLERGARLAASPKEVRLCLGLSHRLPLHCSAH